MIDEKDYNSVSGKLISTKFGDVRRERAELMKRMIFRNDATVKPRIREITLQMLELMRKQ